MTFMFEGELVTAVELSRRLPAYKPGWLLDAMREGCTTRTDLAERDRRKRANSLAGSRKGKAAYMQASGTGGKFIAGRPR